MKIDFVGRAERLMRLTVRLLHIHVSFNKHACVSYTPAYLFSKVNKRVTFFSVNKIHPGVYKTNVLLYAYRLIL